MKYIELAKGIKMLQKDRFYAILGAATALGVLYLLPDIIRALH